MPFSLGSSSYGLTLIPGSYDVAFVPGSCGGASPCDGGTIRHGVAPNQDGSLDLDVAAVRVTGKLRAGQRRQQRHRARFEELFPQHRTVLFPNARHFIQEDEPERIATEIRRLRSALDLQMR